MPAQRSYKIKEFSTTTESEVKRLKAQVELFRDKEARCYSNFGLRNGMAIIDCGSGPGYFIETLLDEFPNSSVTGVEIDPYLVDISIQNLNQKGIANYRVLQKSIMHTGLPENSFDFAFSRLVLEHLPDPVAAVREMYRVLKPGGKAILIDNDFEMHLITSPHIPELDELYNAYCKSRIDEGGNPKIGRELPGILKKSGFVNIDMEIVSAHSELVGDKSFLNSEGVGISLQLVKDGYLKRDTLDNIAKQWRTLLTTDDHAFFRQLFIAVGEKKLTGEKIGREKEQVQLNIYSKITPEELLSAAPAERSFLFEKYLCELIAASRNIEFSKVTRDTSVVDIGVDSLAAVDVQMCVESHLGIHFSIADFFEKKIVRDIAKWLLSELNQKRNNEKLSEEDIKRNINHMNNDADLSWEEGEI